MRHVDEWTLIGLAAVTDGILTKGQADILYDTLHEQKEVFDWKIGGVKMPKLTPMEVFLKKGVAPFRKVPHHIGVVEKDALREKLPGLIQAGMIERKPNPYFFSSAFLVRNKTGEFRRVVPLREVNSKVVPNVVNVADGSSSGHIVYSICPISTL